ncbi:MAG: alpha-galactosidase [Fimbriimonas sp.]
MLPILTLAPQEPVVFQERDRVVVQNGRTRVTIDRRSGRYDIAWGDAASISSAAGEVRLADGRLLKTSDYARHDVAANDVRRVRDGFGSGVQVTLRHRNPGSPELRHVFWVYAGRPEAIVRLEAMDAASLRSNYLAPVVSATDVSFRRPGPLQALFVPYDNDAYIRYRTDAWGETSHEVGAVYDDRSRNGVVVGSIDHDLWKSGVRFTKGEGLIAFAGFTSKNSRDQEPHGMVAGRHLRSPRIALGYYPDWREGMERYGDLNAIVRPPLPWKGGVPFGWNSWSAHMAKLKVEHGRAATDVIHQEMPEFRNDGTAFINLDSFWDNLTVDQRKAFVTRAHAAGLKAGTYWTPFVSWGELDTQVGDGKHRYIDLALKDANGKPLPKLDGGYPLDPTHPGTLARIDRMLKEFVDHGFDFVKLDFMTHGSLEGVHFDPKVTTGTAAYAVGMKRVVENLAQRKIGRPFFISLSIAPLFPQGFAHSRRVSCDVFDNIGASEYLLNSSAYGWWTDDRIYRFNDPDHTVVYRPLGSEPSSEAEARTRFTASVISGGMMLDGDDFTDPKAVERVKRLFANREALDLARKAISFRPIDGDTGSKAGDGFVHVEPNGKTAYVAVFNFSKTDVKAKTVALSRLGLSGSWTVRDMWTGTTRTVDREVTFSLPPMECALVRLTRP